MQTFTVEKIDRNDDGSVTFYGTTPDGQPMVLTLQAGEMVTRIKRADEE